MTQRGRKSAAALAVVREAPSVVRLRPPAELTAVERSLWLEVVNSKPAEWFGPEHGPLLRGYVKHSIRAQLLDEQIDAFDPEWLKDEDGLKRYDRLLAMREREMRAASSLATRMRITQQGVWRADKAGTLSQQGGGGRKPWQTVDDSDES
jgi:hypothetical protein